MATATASWSGGRWSIELFFGWVKQTLRITRFIGTSENAVRIQIAIALIAFLLLRLAQAIPKRHHKPTGLQQARSRSCTAVQSSISSSRGQSFTMIGR